MKNMNKSSELTLEQRTYGSNMPYIIEDIQLQCGAYFEINTVLKTGAIGHVQVSGQMIEMEWDQYGAVKNKGERIITDKFEIVITNIYDFIIIHKYHETIKNHN